MFLQKIYLNFTFAVYKCLNVKKKLKILKSFQIKRFENFKNIYDNIFYGLNSRDFNNNLTDKINKDFSYFYVSKIIQIYIILLISKYINT